MFCRNLLAVRSLFRYAFISYLVKEEILPHEIMQRKIRIQEPETLPKAIPQEDTQLLLDAIASVRDAIS